MRLKKWPTYNILNIKVDFPTKKQALKWAERVVNYNKICQITTPNPEQVVLAQKDLEFRRVLNSADLSICDGVGLLWAIKLGAGNMFLKAPSQNLVNSVLNPSPKSVSQDLVINNDHKLAGENENIISEDSIAGRERVIFPKKDFALSRLSGTDLMLDLCRLAVERGWKVMLIGGRKGIAALAAEKIKNLKSQNQNYNKKFEIVGIEGSRDIKNETDQEKQKIIKKINQFAPHLLFVAYGAPWQEKWIARNLSKIKVNIAMGVGGAFDYFSGRVRRAPNFVRKIGIEWLWRLFSQPWRLKRQLALLRFIWLVIFNKILIKNG